jgi:hypothetical protein
MGFDYPACRAKLYTLAEGEEYTDQTLSVIQAWGLGCVSQGGVLWAKTVIYILYKG